MEIAFRMRMKNLDGILDVCKDCNNMKSHIFVEKLNCQDHATTVAETLEALRSVSEVNVDIETGKVSFICQDDICRMDVLSALRQLSYP